MDPETPTNPPANDRRGPGYYVMVVLIFLAGAGILLYPAVSNAWNTWRNARLATDYNRHVDTLSKEQRLQMMGAARAYNAAHPVNTIVDVFGKNKDGQTPDAAYAALLDPSKNGIMGSVEIPKIRLRLAVYHGTSAAVLEKGVGHVQGTSLPVGGSGTHAVLAAHRGLPSAKLFTDLDQIKKGNHFYLVILGQTLAYRVDKISVVKPDALDALAIEPGRDLVTLLTCTPYGVNTERLLVRGHRVPYVPKTKAAEKGPLIDRNLAWKLLLVGLMSAAVILTIMKRRMADRQAPNESETKE